MATPVAAEGMTLLSDPQNAVVDIVFVHGLQGHPRKTWSSKPKPPQTKSRATLAPSAGASKGGRSAESSPSRISFFDRFKQSRKKNKEEGTDDADDKEPGAKEIFWPEDFLKQDLPKARIMTFGYNTIITQGYHGANQGNIFSHARNLLYGLEAKRRQAPNRQLIFVAHSLGGILVKEVLRRSEVDLDTTIKKVFRSTTGIFFFGTPHRGSRDWASFGEGLATIASHLLRINVNSQVIHALLPSGAELELCRESFAVQWEQRRDSLTISLYYFAYLLCCMLLIAQHIVPPDSSKLDHPSERARMIDGNHVEMVKFSDKNDKGYEMVKEDIDEIIEKAKKVSVDPILGLNEEERKCLQTLDISHYEEFKERNRARLAGTCEWVLQNDRFKKWQQSQLSSLLWVSADPGCGKSVLSKSLVDQDLERTESRAVCYFFFKDDNDKQKSVACALCALLHQLFRQKPSLLRHALPSYTAKGKTICESFHELWRILTAAAADPGAGEIICILDALDECEESGRYNIIEALSVFYKVPAEPDPFKLKFLVTSRPYLDIERRFCELTRDIPTIRLQGEKETEQISHEIDIVIKDMVPKLGSDLGLDELERSTLESELLNMTHRTYLWLKLTEEVIRKESGLTNRKLKQIIRVLPATVDQAYEAILSKVQERDEKRARKLLHIVVAATRPLTLKEMNIALAIEDHHRSEEELDLEKESSFAITVRDLCGLFVSIIDRKVYLIHQTAKEFLIAKSEACVGQWKHSLGQVESQLVMAKICITYLLFHVFDKRVAGQTTALNSDAPRLAERHALFLYAAHFWAEHFRLAQEKADDETLHSVLEISDPQAWRFEQWFPEYSNVNLRSTIGLDFNNAITVVSYLGHEVIVKLLLSTGSVDPDSKDRFNGRTPLSIAAENGHEAVVKLLLNTGGVDPDSKDQICARTPLSLAAEDGHEAVVKLLLNAGGVDPDSKDYHNQTPLSLAAGNGHEAVVKLLLGRVDADSRDNDGRTPLLCAVQIGREAIVQQLLDTGRVNPDLEDNDGWTPLSWAEAHGPKAIFKLLCSYREKAS